MFQCSPSKLTSGIFNTLSEFLLTVATQIISQETSNFFAMLVCYIKKIFQIQRFVFERTTNQKKPPQQHILLRFKIQVHCNITLLSQPQIAYILIEAGEGWKDKFKMQSSAIRWTKQQLRHYNTINRVK